MVILLSMQRKLQFSVERTNVLLGGIVFEELPRMYVLQGDLEVLPVMSDQKVCLECDGDAEAILIRMHRFF